MTDAITATLPLTPDDAAEDSWRAVYRIGAAVALVTLAAMLLDIVLTMIPGWGTTSVPVDVPGWFAQFATNPLLGIRNLDFLNIAVSTVAIPMYVAIFGALRRSRPALALVALLFVAAGTAVFVANNAALPMLELSRRYAVAATPAERLALQSAGEALLARGAHGSWGAFLGFFISEAGTLLMALSMLRGRVFGPRTAWIGIVGASILTAYTVAMTFAAGSEVLVNVVAIPGGLLMMAWNVAVARRLFALAGSERSSADEVSVRSAVLS